MSWIRNTACEASIYFLQPTITGAIVSICCVTFIVFMLAVELLWFIAPDIKSELIVENADPTERYIVTFFLFYWFVVDKKC
jgi:hypothetical protein